MRLIESAPDEPRAAALLEAYFTERTAGFPGGGYRTALPDPTAFLPPGVFLVGEVDGAAAACGGLRPLAGDGPLRLEVKHLYVAPAARGRGAGRALLAELETRARAAGAVQLLLDTNRSLEAAAGLYRSSGFEAVPPYNDNPNATDWFAKPLA